MGLKEALQRTNHLCHSEHTTGDQGYTGPGEGEGTEVDPEQDIAGGCRTSQWSEAAMTLSHDICLMNCIMSEGEINNYT